jgi:hypothetical protein
MEEAKPVWMVHARTPFDGVRGALSVDDRAVQFRPDSERLADTVIPFDRIRKVRRALGSPVLEVEISINDAPPVIGFYFVKPPTLNQPTEGYRPFGRFLTKRKAIAKLRAGNHARKQEVDAWVDRLRAGRRGSGASG